MTNRDPKQKSKSADIDIPVIETAESVEAFLSPDRYEGRSKNVAVHELFQAKSDDKPRLMPGRRWNQTSNNGVLARLGLGADLDKLEHDYVETRLLFERTVTEKNAAKHHHIEDHSGWPLSKQNNEGDYLLLDTSKGEMEHGAYETWLLESLVFYKRKTSLLLRETDPAKAKELEKSAIGLEDTYKIKPVPQHASPEDKKIGAKTLEVGLYKNRLKHFDRGFDPRGFRLDAHHIPYSVTIDISQKIKALKEKGLSPKDAKGLARGEAKAEGPVVMLPWDMHKKLHEFANGYVFTQAKGSAKLMVHETAGEQLQNDFDWLRQQLHWIGYSDHHDINPAMEALKPLIKEYKGKKYPDPVLPTAPVTTIIHHLGDLDKLMNGGQGGSAHDSRIPDEQTRYCQPASAIFGKLHCNALCRQA